MHCRSCGAEQLEGSLSCDTCGALLDSGGRAVVFAPEPAAAVALAEPEAAPVEDLRPRCADHPEFPQVGTCARCGKFICVRCAPEASERESPRCEACVAREEGESSKELKGIGGWLLLLGIQLVLATVLDLVVGAYGLTQGSGLSLLLLALGVYTAATAYFFFRQKAIAPLLVLGYLAVQGIYAVVSAGTGQGSAFRLIPIVLWAFYVLGSKRVRNTFVN